VTISSELSRRNVIRAGIAYAVASWVLLQIVDAVIPILELPEWTPKLIFVVLAIGLVLALALLADDPRFAKIEAAILETINANLAVVGVQLFNADFSVVED
jgi:hypothetical protein